MRGDGIEGEEENAEDVRQMAEDDLAGRRIFEEEDTEEEGGAKAERLREREESANSTNES
jgi:hypothetical protein